MSMNTQELNTLEADFEGLTDLIQTILDKYGREYVIDWLQKELEMLTKDNKYEKN